MLSLSNTFKRYGYAWIGSTVINIPPLGILLAKITLNSIQQIAVCVCVCACVRVRASAFVWVELSPP